MFKKQLEHKYYATRSSIMHQKNTQLKKKNKELILRYQNANRLQKIRKQIVGRVYHGSFKMACPTIFLYMIIIMIMT